MLEQLGRAWRVVGTAIAFASFGLACLALGLLYFPLLSLLVRQRARRERLARLMVQRGFGLFVEWMRVLGLLRYRILGAERLQRKGLLILANHPTLIDAILLISRIADADCVAKAGLAHNPFTRLPLRATGYICNDSGPGVVEDCIRSIRAGHNLVIFPEGTRTPENGEMKLQRGAANVAVRGDCNITPVTIRCEPLFLTKGRPWWRVPLKAPLLTIEVGEDIIVQPFMEQAGQIPSLAARRLTKYLHLYFLKETQAHAGA